MGASMMMVPSASNQISRFDGVSICPNARSEGSIPDGARFMSGRGFFPPVLRGPVRSAGCSTTRSAVPMPIPKTSQNSARGNCGFVGVSDGASPIRESVVFRIGNVTAAKTRLFGKRRCCHPFERLQHRRPSHMRSMLKGDRDRHTMFGIQSISSIEEVASFLARPGGIKLDGKSAAER